MKNLFKKTPNSIILIAAVIAALGSIGAVLGVDWPLTENSPVVEALHNVDENYAGQFQIQELEIYRINEEILQAKTARLEGSIESDGFLLGQYDKPNLTEGERFQKNRLLRRIEKHKRELDRLDKE